MSGLFTKILTLPIHFPLVRGMMSYAIIWPTCSIVQEYLEHGTTLENANWGRAARFGVFGTFFMAPVFYGWMKYSSRFFTRKDLITAMTRAVAEQLTYSPLAMAYFFFGMSLLEGKPYRVCINEVHEKFWPTYKIGVIFWPTAQTLNFYFISEPNRIIFVSLASFIWTVYLAHMKGKHQKNEEFLLESSQLISSMPAIDESTNKGPMVAVEINSDLSDQTPLEAQGDINDASDMKQVIVVERSSDVFEKPPELVSDVHAQDSVPHKIVERHSEPAIEKKPVNTSVKSSSESAVDKKNS